MIQDRSTDCRLLGLIALSPRSLSLALAARLHSHRTALLCVLALAALLLILSFDQQHHALAPRLSRFARRPTTPPSLHAVTSFWSSNPI